MAIEPVHIENQLKASLNLPLDPDDAKQLVFDQWQFLSRLAERRFPNDDSMAQEALLFVLEKLEAGEWKRVRAWEGQGAFHTFLAVLTARLMTDYTRSKYGHHRTPTWINRKNDLVWTKAYQLIIFQKYSRLDAIEILMASYRGRDRWYFEEMVATILAKNNRPVRAIETQVPIDAVEYLSAFQSPDNTSDISQKVLLEAVIEYLNSDENSEENENQEVQRLLSLLNIELSLSEEDKLLLKMRYCDGMTISAITKALDLKGDIYKRINKLIRHLTNACTQMGVLDDIA
jgi:RNA polymerase sigma factor (sigma-70 family)